VEENTASALEEFTNIREAKNFFFLIALLQTYFRNRYSKNFWFLHKSKKFISQNSPLYNLLSRMSGMRKFYEMEV